MSSAAKKLDDDSSVEFGNVPTERELKLAKDFEDPALEELIPTAAAGSPLSVVEEAASAVQELVVDAAGFELPAELPQPPFSLEGDAAEALPLPEGVDEIALLDAPSPAPAGAAPRPAAGKAQAAAHRPLPQAVNPDPDPIERTLILPNSPEGDAISFDGVSQESDASRFEMSSALFDLVACERTFDDIVESGLRTVMKALGAHAGSVLELDREKEDFFFRASLGGATSLSQLKTFRVPLTKGIVGHVAESGQALLIRNLTEDTMQMRAISLSVGFEAITCMAAPIIVGGEPYGVIEVFNKLDGSFFDERDLVVLEEGVRMLAKVLEVRFLMAELIRRVR